MGIDVIFFAAIAVLLGLRLWSMLGKKGGHKGPSPLDHLTKGSRENRREREKVVPLHPGVDEEEEEDLSRHPARAGLLAIRDRMPGFRSDEFLVGARAAFEMIVSAFARGDRAMLNSLLAPDVFSGFEEAITAREAAKQSRESNVIGILSADIVKARINEGQAEVTVRFVSEQINATRAEDGALVEGDLRHVEKITDIWTFARDVAAEDPNWLLISTGLNEAA